MKMKSTIVHHALAVALIALGAGSALAQAPAAAEAAPATADVAPAAAASAGAAGETGQLAWYGRKFAGRKTASGEAYTIRLADGSTLTAERWLSDRLQIIRALR